MDSFERKIKNLLKLAGKKPTCPSEFELASLLDGVLSPDDELKVATHLARCEKCRELVGMIIEMEEEVAGRLPEKAANFAKSIFKPTTTQRVRASLSKIINPQVGKSPALSPALAVRGAGKVMVEGAPSHQSEFGPYRAEVEVERMARGQFQVLVSVMDAQSGKSAKGLRASLCNQSRELESLVFGEGRAIFENVSAGEYLVRMSKNGDNLAGIAISIKETD